ncbi:HNH endonuclease signature motif containing protein [Vulgatibacter sp.]|uniref:HNH endonuclease signature motif containing protein n=1 Tax=Vulgatibacter sp. TaxID=1971226 RepID=UPI003567BB1D
MAELWLVREDGPKWGADRRGRREALERELAEAAAQVDAAIHRLLGLVRRCDEAGFWTDGGFKSCAHWLASKVGIGVGAAKEQVRVAHAIARLPLIDAALRAGEVSYSQVRAITRAAEVETEEALLTLAKKLPAAKLERFVHAVATAKAAAEGLPSPESVLLKPYAKRRSLGDGMSVLEVYARDEQIALIVMALDAVQLEMIEGRKLRRNARAPGGGEAADAAERAGGDAPAATEQAAEEQREGEREPAPMSESPPEPGPGSSEPSGGDWPELPPTPPQPSAHGRVEALVALSESWLQGGLGPGARRPNSVALFADRQTLASSGIAWFADGTAISAETARRQTCAATIVPVRAGPDGNLLDIGRRSRVPTEKQETALLIRDRCCRFPGCSNEAFIDAHHIVHWAQGGPTNLDNLLLLCKRHHTLVHEGGFRCEVVGGLLQFRMPDGSLLSEEPLERPPRAEEPDES